MDRQSGKEKTGNDWITKTVEEKAIQIRTRVTKDYYKSSFRSFFINLEMMSL
jgi:hypothetical protein